MSTVTILEQQLAEAKRAEAQKHKADLRTKLREVRAALREMTKRYDKMAQAILDERELKSLLQKRIETAQEMLDASWAGRPPAFDHLGDTDPECAQWHGKHAALEQQRDKLIAQRNAVPDTDLLEAIHLKSAIERLQYHERNILNSLNGSLGRGPTASIEALR